MSRYDNLLSSHVSAVWHLREYSNLPVLCDLRQIKHLSWLRDLQRHGDMRAAIDLPWDGFMLGTDMRWDDHLCRCCHMHKRTHMLRTIDLFRSGYLRGRNLVCGWWRFAHVLRQPHMPRGPDVRQHCDMQRRIDMRAGSHMRRFRDVLGFTDLRRCAELLGMQLQSGRRQWRRLYRHYRLSPPV
jgi:hypothetical protein